MVFLMASAIPIRRILGMVGAGHIRTIWLYFCGTIAMFWLGYAILALHGTGMPAGFGSFVLGSILLSGGAFVFAISALSCATTRDLLRIAMLEQDVVHDSLTSAFNRRFMENKLAEEIERAVRYRIDLSVIMMDLDHFKRVNDKYGHQTGDLVLRSTAMLMMKTLRTNDVLVRYGGEEFVIIAPETSLLAAKTLSERIRRNIAKTKIGLADGEQLSVTVSLGVATLEHGDTPETLVAKADQAVYVAKQSGRNRTCMTSPRHKHEAA